MPTLKRLCELLGWPRERTTKAFVAKVRKESEAARPIEQEDGDMVRLSDWKEDYSWPAVAAAVRDGYMLKPVPEGWQRIRDIAESVGGKEAVPWFLASGEESAQVIRDAGIYDRCRMDEYYDLHCTDADAAVLLEYAKPKWDALQAARGRR